MSIDKDPTPPQSGPNPCPNDVTVGIAGLEIQAVANAKLQADSRSSLTSTFLCASAVFAKRASEIEAASSNEEIAEGLRVEHQGAVLAAIMQAVASLEAEIYEVVVHGPGHHLGSNGVDLKSRKFLSPMADIIDDQGVLERYELVLHLLRKEPLLRSEAMWENASLLVKLRNEVTHYKSRWNSEVERKKLLASLRNLRYPKPPFVSEYAQFFPHQCLSATCAAWAVRSALSFLTAINVRLGFPDRLSAVAVFVAATLPRE